MKTCLPAAAVRSTWAPCWLCGVANTTASIAGSARICSRSSLQCYPALGTERFGRSARPGVACSEADRAALSLHRIDRCSAPAAEADDAIGRFPITCCARHVILPPRPISRRGRRGDSAVGGATGTRAALRCYARLSPCKRVGHAMLLNFGPISSRREEGFSTPQKCLLVGAHRPRIPGNIHHRKGGHPTLDAGALLNDGFGGMRTRSRGQG